MKKVISLLSAIAVICTLMTTVVFADENHSVALVEKSRTENTITYSLVVKATGTDMIRNFVLEANLSDANSKNIAYSGTQVDAATYVVDTDDYQSVFATYQNPKGFTGTLELGTITFDFTNATAESFTITEGYEGFLVQDRNTVSATNIDITAKFTNGVFGATISKPKAEEETYGTPIETGDYKGKTLYFDDKTLTFKFGTHEGILIKKGSEEKKFGLKFFEDLGVSAEAGSEMTFTAGVIDASGAAKGTYEFSLIEKTK